jgi:methylthioribose-1-phosphate isomerase
MAERLAAARVSVTFFTDAAIAHALEGADAVVIGADAVTPAWFLNKSGTRLLAAAATQQGVPVYVCATRDKFLSTPLAARLTIREERPDEIWPAPPPNVSVHNRYFEPTSLDLVTAVISDLGVLGAGVVPDACLSPHDDLLSSLGGP